MDAHQSYNARIDGSVSLGNFTNINPSVTIKANTRIGNFVSISWLTSIGSNCQVDNHANINERCAIGNDVVISSFANIGAGATIETGSVFFGFTSTGNDARIRNRVKLNKHASIGSGVEIQDDSFIDEFSSIGSSVKISPKVYIGKHASIGSNSIVHDSAIVHRFVNILNGATIVGNAVVIGAPSTFELYQKCAPIEGIPEQVRIANDRSAQPSVRFNGMLRGLLDAQINDVKAKCEQGYMIAKPDLSTIKSLYLIHRYGLKRFNQTQQTVQQALNGGGNIMTVNGEVYINGSRFESENYFEENSDNNILEPDVKKKLIQLLAIDEEAEREHRMENETFSSVTTQILNGERKVTVAKPSQGFVNGVNISNNYSATGSNNANVDFNSGNNFGSTNAGNFNFNNNNNNNFGNNQGGNFYVNGGDFGINNGNNFNANNFGRSNFDGNFNFNHNNFGYNHENNFRHVFNGTNFMNHVNGIFNKNAHHWN